MRICGCRRVIEERGQMGVYNKRSEDILHIGAWERALRGVGRMKLRCGIESIYILSTRTNSVLGCLVNAILCVGIHFGLATHLYFRTTKDLRRSLFNEF